MNSSAPKAALSAIPAVPALLTVVVERGAQSRAAMARLLWPDASDDAAARNLRQRLFRLAKAGRARIVKGKDSIRIAGGVQHDLDAASAVAAGREGSELLRTLEFSDHEDLAGRIAQLRDPWAQRCVPPNSGARRMPSNGNMTSMPPWQWPSGCCTCSGPANPPGVG